MLSLLVQKNTALKGILALCYSKALAQKDMPNLFETTKQFMLGYGENR